jgi:hypothetical protein
VWAAVRFGQFLFDLPVTCLGTRDGRFYRVEDEDGHRHSVARYFVFATREELLRKFPELRTEVEK